MTNPLNAWCPPAARAAVPPTRGRFVLVLTILLAGCLLGLVVAGTSRARAGRRSQPPHPNRSQPVRVPKERAWERPILAARCPRPYNHPGTTAGGEEIPLAGGVKVASFGV